MAEGKELKYEDLNYLNIDLRFDTTDDVPNIDGLVGQERAVRAIELGFSMKKKGYNIYAAGLKACGKTSYASDCARELAAKRKTPDDYCYVYNFDDPKRPKALSFPAGKGSSFRDDMEELAIFFSEEIPRVFSSEEFDADKNEIIKSYQDARDDLMDSMETIAAEYEFGVKTTNSGIYFLPKIDGQTIDEEDYDSLDEELKSKFSKLSDIVQEKASEVMRKIKEHEKSAKEQMDEMEYKVGMFTISKRISEMKSKYKDSDEASQYLDKVTEDVLDNLEDFMEKDEEEEQLSSMIPWLAKKSDDNILNKYKVNLIVDNSGLKGAPVVKDFNPTYYNLIGEFEYDNELGNLVTDFMKIKPGLLHRANGGFLILQAADLLMNDKSWDCLKLALKNNKIEIAPLREHLSSITSTLKPDPIPLDVKIVITGSPYYYEVLKDFDEDFDELFKVLAEFDYEMDFNETNIFKFASFIKNFTTKNKSMAFDSSGVKEVIKYSMRVSERRDKLSTQFGVINELLEEATMYAELEGRKTVGAANVKEAAQSREYRNRMYEEKNNALFIDQYINIDTQGKKIGQINGLSVIDTGNHTFGSPVRITATTFIGSAGIINIEKEAEMSGSIHEKGMQVLSGFFGQTYAQEFPLSLSAKICFEQSYSQIDGDSASCAELLAVLSSLADVPIRQEIAVTGSVNQMGEVQAVGGVAYKIEGFFNLCSARGLTGTQGVIIPRVCERDLVLKDEVVEAIKAGKFHIYCVSSVDEAISIAMGTRAGKRLKTGKFEPKTVHALAFKKLKAYYGKTMQEQVGKK